MCVVGAFDALELTHAVQVNSLGLMSDAFHMLFHFLGMLAALSGMVLSRTPPSFAFSYGYDRGEVLASFTASTCLLFVCLFLAVQAFHRVLNPEPLETSHMLEFGVGGLTVNFVGLLLFGGVSRGRLAAALPGGGGGGGGLPTMSASALHGGSGGSSGATAATSAAAAHRLLGAHQGNMEAVKMHLVSDAMSSMAVIVSSLLVRMKGWPSVDALQSLAVAALTMYNLLPLLRVTGLILLQSRPTHLKAALDRCRREASAVDGVLECSDEHFWTQSPSVVVGTVCVRVRSGADEQQILTTVHRVFSKHVTHLTIQVEKDPPLDWLTGGDVTGSSAAAAAAAAAATGAASSAGAAVAGSGGGAASVGGMQGGGAALRR